MRAGEKDADIRQAKSEEGEEKVLFGKNLKKKNVVVVVVASSSIHTHTNENKESSRFLLGYGSTPTIHHHHHLKENEFNLSILSLPSGFDLTESLFLVRSRFSTRYYFNLRSNMSVVLYRKQIFCFQCLFEPCKCHGR